MRKVLVLVLVVLLFSSGCANKRDSADEIRELIDDTKTEINTLYEESSSDSEFWASVERAAKLVSETVISHCKYDIIFILETSGGDYFVLEQLQDTNEVNQPWRDLCKNQIILELASQKKVKEAHLANEKVRVYSTTLNCPVRNSDGDGWYMMSAVDNDNDGVWDEKGISY